MKKIILKFKDIWNKHAKNFYGVSYSTMQWVAKNPS